VNDKRRTATLPGCTCKDRRFAAAAAAISHQTRICMESRGVFTTTDGGRRWRLGGLASESVWGLAIHPSKPGVVYAGTDRSGVYFSENGGRTWRPFSEGLSTPRVTVLAIDAAGRKLYAGTNGGGVFALTLPE